MGPNRRQAITWTNADRVHRRIYVALGGDELKSDSCPVINIATLVAMAWHIVAPRCNGIFKCIFFNENASVLIKISVKFVPNGPVDTK